MIHEFQAIYSHIDIEIELDVEENDITDSLKIQIYRVIQEALNNIAKHSDANKARLIFKKNSEKREQYDRNSHAPQIQVGNLHSPQIDGLRGKNIELSNIIAPQHDNHTP